MPTGLRRYQTEGHDHLITFSCYRRLPFLNDDHAKTTFEHTLEETRATYGFEVHAYVTMPEHVHVLLSEPDSTLLATAINVLKFRTSRKLKGDREQFWQTRYHDVNILTHRRWLNALRYIHANPVKRGLVEQPEDWRWSSYLHWSTGQPHTVYPDPLEELPTWVQAWQLTPRDQSRHDRWLTTLELSLPETPWVPSMRNASRTDRRPLQPTLPWPP